MVKYHVFPVVLLYVVMGVTEVTWVKTPTMQKVGTASEWTIQFELSAVTDIEVSIVNTVDSSIVCHLAAGKLGATPPAPFTANSLSQTLTWDGKDDLGNTVTGASYGVRVRAGMSVSLDRLADQNPYFYQSINGATLGSDGSIYIYGLYGSYGSPTIRKYDPSGDYLKTVYPYPAGADTAGIYGWGLNFRDDGTYCPVYPGNGLPRLSMSGSLLENTSCLSMNFTLNDNLMIYSGTTMQLVNDNGAVAHDGGSVGFISSPALPQTGSAYVKVGASFYAKGMDGKSIYLSGFCFAGNPNLNYAYTLDRTSFWRDGNIYCINAQTGATTLWRTIINQDSIPDFQSALRLSTIGPQYNGNPTAQLDFTAIHGIDFDAAGRLYVCDRLHQCLSVFDTTTMAVLAKINVPDPHQVTVNRSTGEIYVLSRRLDGYATGVVSLRKFASYSNPTLTASLLNFIPSITHNKSLVRFVVSFGGSKPVLWVTANTVAAYQDDGSQFTMIKNFNQLAGEVSSRREPALYERMAVDRKTETLYFTNGWTDFYKINDWSTAKASRCSTTALKPLYAGEVACGLDGSVYIRQGTGQDWGGDFNGKITKYTGGAYLAPSNFGTTFSNVIDTFSYGRYGIAYGDKGIGVARDGKVGYMDMIKWTTYGVHIAEPDGTVRDSSFYPIADGMYTGRMDIPYGSGGVKFDKNGNVYMGISVLYPDHDIPTGFAKDDSYKRQGVGSVVKFPPTGGYMSGTTAVNALKVYQQDLGAFSGSIHFCQCRSPRFDLDTYDRLFIPCALTSRVSVTDNAGNEILSFGNYGNVDSKGPGSLVPGPAIPLAAPLTVAASDNYIYIGDINNARLVRVKMNYALDNFPGVHAAAVEKSADPLSLELTSAPNPFNPVSRIAFKLSQPSTVRLGVYGLDGRLIRNLNNGTVRAGTHQAIWNGRDQFDRPVASGAYVYRLDAAGKVLMVKTIFEK